MARTLPAGTVLKLGTKQHHDRLLGVIDSLDATGCFALTELGFGEHRILSACVCTLQHVTCCGVAQLRRSGHRLPHMEASPGLCRACDSLVSYQSSLSLCLTGSAVHWQATTQ